MAWTLKRLTQLIEEIRWEDATSPKWWVKFARRQVRLYFYIVRETLRDRCMQQAAALTYTTLLSLVPLLAVAFSFFRAFEAFKGVEKSAQEVIFRTVLASPLVEGARQPEGQQYEVPEDMSAQEMLAKADALPRLAGAQEALWLYMEALSRGADPAAVRKGIGSLYFGAPHDVLTRLRELGSAHRRAYADAAGVTIVDPPKEMPAKESVRLYLESVSLPVPAEGEGWVGREDQHPDPETAAAHCQAVAQKLADALVIYAGQIKEETAEAWIEEHGVALEKLGGARLALGRKELEHFDRIKAEAPQAAEASLDKAIEYLRQAALLLERSAEVDLELADALWLADRKEEAREYYRHTSEKGKELAARGLSTTVSEYIGTFAEKAARAGLGAVGILFLVITSVSMLNTIEKTLNDIWQVKDKRPFWNRFTSFCTLIWLGPALLGVSILARESLADKMEGALGGLPVVGAAFSVVAALGKYVLPFAMVWLLLTGMYKFLPNTRVRFRAAAWGAFLATVFIQLARPTYGLYVSHAIKYEKIYGSLGAVPIFLLWLWVLWLLVLFGAEVAFTVQNVSLLRFQDRLRRLSNLFIDRYLAVRIMLYVARELWASGRPMSVEKLAETLHMPPEEALDSASRLVKLGLLTPVGEQLDEFHPAKALSKLTVMEVLSITDRFRRDSRSTHLQDKPYEDSLEEIFRTVIASQDQALRDATFRDLLESCAGKVAETGAPDTGEAKAEDAAETDEEYESDD